MAKTFSAFIFWLLKCVLITYISSESQASHWTIPHLNIFKIIWTNNIKIIFSAGYNKKIAKPQTDRLRDQGTGECHSTGQCWDLEGSSDWNRTKYLTVWSTAFSSCLLLQVVPPRNLPTYFLVSELSGAWSSWAVLYHWLYSDQKQENRRDNSLSLMGVRPRKLGEILPHLGIF